jgi:aldose 1-epimerase
MTDTTTHTAAAIAPFGETGGRRTQLFTLESGALRARLADYAGALVSLEAPDREGRRDHVVLGFGDVGQYVAAGGSFGALLGRTANRIAGGRLVIDGVEHRLSQNENGNTLHGGARGFNKQFWAVVDAGPSHLALALDSPDGDQGFPGDVHVEAVWRLDGAALSLTLTATTTRPTPLSLSAHPYFNLDGPGSLHCLDHEIEIAADQILETDARQIPTGIMLPVADTPFDFRQPHTIGARIREPDPQLRHGKGYDHCFVLARGKAGALRRAARVRSRSSGRTLDILTTHPSIQFYSGNNLNGSAAGRGGLYRQSAGFAIEPQGFPDAPNHPNFPSTILRPGERYRQEIVYRLGTIAEV